MPTDVTSDATEIRDHRSDDARWRAVVARDAAADEHFVYAVKTTGVYCRPSSSARLPKRENVEFFDTPLLAEAAGYRPSQRASADRTVAARHRMELVAKACALIDSAESPPNLDLLAEQAGMSPFHFHRTFKTETGPA
jgi:AraC family transcriptional regulator, regulatory protein of adaptative response / methylated-DNA-[protein]-cysteine methyltransferase